MIKKIPLDEFGNSSLLASFDCGEDDVNHFLWDKAVDKESKNLFSTTLFFSEEDNRIVGYYSLTSSIVEITNVYDAHKFKDIGAELDLDSDKAMSFPAIELSWFGVDRNYQGQHWGANIMFDILRQVAKIRYTLHVGFIGIIVDALASAAEFYEKYGFSYLHADYGTKPVFLKSYAMFVAIDNVNDIISRSE